MIVSGWSDGHGTYGLRVNGDAAMLWFRPEWRWITLHLPGEPTPACVPITPSFWEGSPELRSPRVRRFFEGHSVVPWPRNRPPHFELEPLGGGVFRLRWLGKTGGQQRLALD